MAIRAASAASAIATAVPPTTTVWTPIDASGAGLTLTALTCLYTRLGGMVFITGTLQYPANANGLNAKIGGLPFPTLNGVGVGGFNVIFYGTAPGLALIPDQGATTFSILTMVGVNVTNATLNTAGLRFQFMYPAA